MNTYLPSPLLAPYVKVLLEVVKADETTAIHYRRDVFIWCF
ncbi:MAG: hypothetical protein R2738_04595 [Bacteroides graminisolvens]